MKTCEVCGNQFSPKRRSDAKTCSVACRRRKSRKRQRSRLRPPVPCPTDPRDWHPRSPGIAALALSRGVPLRALNLTPNERDFLIVSDSSFPDQDRYEAGKRLAGQFRWAADENLGRKLDRDIDLVGIIFVAVAEAQGTRNEYLYPWAGRPRIAGRSWTPREESWAVALRLYLPWRVRQLARERSGVEADPLPVRWDEEGWEEEALEDRLPSGERRSSIFAQAFPWEGEGESYAVRAGPNIYRKPESWNPYQALWVPSSAFFDALRLENRVGRRTNPALKGYQLDQIKAQILERWSPAPRLPAGEQGIDELHAMDELRLAVFGKTPEKQTMHFLGWSSEVDTVALAASGLATDFRRRWINRDREAPASDQRLELPHRIEGKLDELAERYPVERSGLGGLREALGDLLDAAA